MTAPDTGHEVPGNLRSFDTLKAIIDRLQSPDGCPWDREQTHESLRKHLIEESYETLDAIDSGDLDALVEELGDLLLQVLMHVGVAERDGEFNLGDVVERIAAKLVRRHPHVFGDVTAESADEVSRNWDRLKREERPERSILEGVPHSMPALAQSQALQGRARRMGFDWPDIDGPLDKLREEIEEFARASEEEREGEFGDVLFVAVNIADHLGIDAEQSLRGANAKFRQRFGVMEELASDRGLRMDGMSLAELDALWDEAKARIAATYDPDRVP